MVDERTHAIIHLEHTNEQQDREGSSDRLSGAAGSDVTASGATYTCSTHCGARCHVRRRDVGCGRHLDVDSLTFCYFEWMG
jgi:hypothetical protein